MPDQIDRLEYLSTKLMDGALSEDESAELSEMLLNSPELRAEFYASVNTDALLVDEYCCDEMTADTPKAPVPVIRPSRTRPKTRRFPILTLASVAAVAICLTAFFICRPRPVMTIETTHKASIHRSGSYPFASADALYDGDRIAMGEDGQMILKSAEQDRLHIIGGSITVKRSKAGYQFVRQGGFMDANITPGLNRSLVFKTKSGTVSVIGTRFSLADRDGRTVVTLHEGSVRISTGKPGKYQKLAAGSSALLRRGKDPTVVATPIPVRRFQANTAGSKCTAYPLSPELKPRNTMSIIAWIRVEKFVKYGGIAGCLWDTAAKESGYGLTLGLKPGTIDFIAFTGKNTAKHEVDWPAARAKIGTGWHLVCGVYNGQSLCLYIDGKLSAKQTTRGQIDYTHSADFQIGRYSDDNDDHRFVGGIRQVMVFDEALSQDAVTLLSSSTHPHQETK